MDYKTTLNLPKTAFPMRASLPKREPNLHQQWEKEEIYQKLEKKQEGKKDFLLHDGPPFANGDAHMGHALNMALKDFVLKSKNMSGFRVPFIPGWDCHGLPIEHKVMKELASAQKGKEETQNNLDSITIREKSKQMALKFIEIQKQQFRRLGVFGEWDKPYITMEPAYEADVLRVFASMVERGLVYQALRPVYWSTGCQTALAEAEVEYLDRNDTSIYVKCPCVSQTTENGSNSFGEVENLSLVIWTTTPWTLPANLAIAIHLNMTYCLVQVKGENEHLLLAKSRIEEVEKVSGKTLETIKEVQGKELVGLEYTHPFLDRKGKVFDAEFVTEESGSGLVHIAPGHGQDDYQLGKKVGLDILSPVDDRGHLTAECGVPELAGQYVFKANKSVVALLKEKNRLLGEEVYTHSYPHCWRSKTPIVFRSVTQWFIRINDFREEALEAIEKVDWIPSWGKNRIRGAVETRPDWCISRQRTWGIPIPAFYQKEEGGNKKGILNAETVRAFADLVEKEGTNIWFEKSSEELCQLLNLDPSYEKGVETLDVWIDSGSSHEAVTRKRLSFPADLYLEGSDQHRGWFQSSLLTSVAKNGEPPYRQVLTNGFVVDRDGKKLSKSDEKSKKPTGLMDFVNQYGADILRLWVASEDYRNDVPFSEEIFKHVSDTYRSFRNSFRILLANLYDFDPEKDKVAQDQLPELDLYLLKKTQELKSQVLEAYRSYEFHKVYHTVDRFCAVELSALYVDVTKDRMYCDKSDSLERRSTQTVMYEVLESLTLLLAPIMPYTTEEAWQFLWNEKEGKSAEGQLIRESIHLQLFPELKEVSVTEDFEKRWEQLFKLRSDVNEKLERAREKKEIGKSLEAKAYLPSKVLVELGLIGNEENKDQSEFISFLEEFLIVSQVEITEEEEIKVERASGKKCLRCWKYSQDLGTDDNHPELCERCTEAVNSNRLRKY